jgi:hypothetical protein
LHEQVGERRHEHHGPDQATGERAPGNLDATPGDLQLVRLAPRKLQALRRTGIEVQPCDDQPEEHGGGDAHGKGESDGDHDERADEGEKPRQ